VTLAASRAFTSSDKLGSWYSYTTWQGRRRRLARLVQHQLHGQRPAGACRRVGAVVSADARQADRRPGDVLNGTVTYQNTSASPIVVQTVGIGMRPPGREQTRGALTPIQRPSLPAQTIQPGATVTLAASRTFTSADPIGDSWYSYTTWQDAAGAWHDSPSINFTVGVPPPPPRLPADW